MNLRLYTRKSLLHAFPALGSPPTDRSLLCCHCRPRDSQDCPFPALHVLCLPPKMLYCVPTLYLTSSELATVFCLAPMSAIHISTSCAESVLGVLESSLHDLERLGLLLWKQNVIGIRFGDQSSFPLGAPRPQAQSWCLGTIIKDPHKAKIMRNPVIARWLTL